MTARIIEFEAPCGRVDPNARGHWRAKAEAVKQWRHAARLAAHNSGPVGYRALVTIEFTVPDRRKRDPHNWVATAKPIVDGLTDAGLWPDDTAAHVTVAEPILVVDPANKDRVRIAIEPAPPARNPFQQETP